MVGLELGFLCAFPNVVRSARSIGASMLEKPWVAASMRQESFQGVLRGATSSSTADERQHGQFHVILEYLIVSVA